MQVDLHRLRPVLLHLRRLLLPVAAPSSRKRPVDLLHRARIPGEEIRRVPLRKPPQPRAPVPFVAASDLNCYMAVMNVARKFMRAAFVLRDHVRLPGRFFGRMTASIQAGL